MCSNAHDEKIQYALTQLREIRIMLRKAGISAVGRTVLNNRIQILEDQLNVKYEKGYLP